MSILYRIYANDGAGGPIDYDHPIATTADLSFTTATLGAPGHHRFGVRTFDPQSGREEANTDASVAIILDTSGRDITARPNPPHALVARPTAGGGLRVSWAYSPAAQGGEPAGFVVSLGVGSPPTSLIPLDTVPYRRGERSYTRDFGGLLDQTLYTVSVRSVGAQGHLISDPVSAGFVADATAPDDVDALIATLNF